MLASAAFTAVVIGLAARSALANPLAGIAIAITQPVRLGDYVTFGDVSGTIEEVGLTYTYIRTADNRRIVIPNEQLASTTLQNHTIVDEASAAAVDFVVSPAAALADVERHRARRGPTPQPRRHRSRAHPDGAGLPADGPASARHRLGRRPTSAERAASDLRLALHERLRAAGLLPEPADPAA